MIKTKEGALQYEHSLNHALEFFSKAGSVYDTKNKQDFYSGNESCLSLFQKTWIVDEELSMKLLFWLRDCRGGAGNRSGFRSCLKWLCEVAPNWVISNIELIPLYGRFDDYRSTFGSSVESSAVKFWLFCMNNPETKILAAKWADRKDKQLRYELRLSECDFRKLLSSIRKNHIVEHKMCSNLWKEINYESVPSVAMARYTNAFNRHDEERFERYKEGLISGEKQINASVLFPHDCVRTWIEGDEKIAEAQFEALPNYLEDVNQRIMVICDTSGSMDCKIGGSVKAIHVSQGMALYCSSKIPKDNPFYKKFIAFCSESKFINWNDKTFSQAVYDRNIFNGAVGSTRIDLALKLILDSARNCNLTNDQIPTTLLIVSDMQFTEGIGLGPKYIKEYLTMFENHGYKPPAIVYWNISGYAGSPDTKYGNNVAMVSGFSLSILKSIFSGEDLTPIGVMNKTLEKYKINIP